jgi:putative aldouronate transport system substrate-binding protein
MRKVRILSKVLVLALCVSFVMSLFGCAQNDDNSAKSDSTATSSTAEVKETEKENVKLTLLYRDEGSANNINANKDNPVYKELEKQTNTTLEIVGWSDDKVKISIAGGDLPDIVCVSDLNTKSLFDAKLIVDMNPLIQKTDSNNLLYSQAAVDFSKTLLKNDGFYFITPGVSSADDKFAPRMKMDVGPVVRWDYYEELGMPSIKNYDDFLNMMEKMVQNHPLTPDGKKVYAFTNLNDWDLGLWTYKQVANPSGVEIYNNVIDVSKDDQKIIPEFYGHRNSYYEGALILNKAYRKGLVHPEAFTMKFADFEAAAVKGEVIFNGAVYGLEKVNAELMKGANPTSFVAIPFDFGYGYSDVAQRNSIPSYKGERGMDGKNWSITTNCENPERAVEFLDYCWSPQGTRLLTSGIEGDTWEYIDGKATLKPATVEMISKGGDEVDKSGAFGGTGSLAHLVGLAKNVMHPDGELANLQNSPSTFVQMMNPVEKDYVEAYGVEYPFQAFVKAYTDGKQKFNPDYKTINMPSMPDEMKRIDTKITDVLVKGLPKIVIQPKSDAEFEIAFSKLKDDLNAVGAQTLYKWTAEEFNKVIAIARGN